MKKRIAVRIISFSLAAVAVAVGFVLRYREQNIRYRLELETGYSRNLDDFNTAINNIALTLNKARYVTTPGQISGMAAKLLTEAELSKAALSQLPSGEELTVLNRFLSQVGNFAMSLSATLINGGELTEEDNKNLELLDQTAEVISELVGNSQIMYNNTEYWAKELDRQIDDAVDGESLSQSFSELEGELSDYPTLIYDGPFSDHILEKEPAMLKGAEAVSRNKALQRASEVAETDKGNLKYDGAVTGSIPAFRFVGEGVTVSVSKAGGYAVYMRKERETGQSLLSYEQAVEKAKRYLERVGIDNMKETYYYTNEGICVVNFAYIDGETVCYTDLIKVGVAMDNGEIMLYEASGYISNHTDRAFETPAFTLEQAREIINKNLTVRGTAIALVPTTAAGEARCYEFACMARDGREILVYINSATLEEERIFILLKGDGGTLVK
ncbi:MAG: germination protein YpeB [Clostridia bacterium]|nr:germination protein YpeB [Clostridia bacterium]